MFKRLLICTDLVDGLQRFVHFVPSLATGGVEHITFLHVLPVDGREIPRIDEAKVQQIREKLSVAQTQAPPGVEVKVEVQSGRVDERILAVMKDHHCDLVIVGAQSRSLLTEKLFGSTSVSVCQHGKVPVLIVRPQLISAYTVEELELRCRHLFRYFLLPYDGSKTSDFLVSQIKRYAEKRPADSLEECLLQWVIEENNRVERMLHDSRVQEAETKLAEIKADLEQLDLKVTSKVVCGEPIPEMLKAALEYDVTAIALASGTMGKLTEWSTPSFAAELMRRSWHPILFFPSI